MMNVVLIHSSVRENRVGPSVVEKVLPLLPRRWKLTVVDPRTYPLPLLYQRYYESPDPVPAVEKLHRIFNGAHGFILVTAEYNHSIPPALKNMLDHFTGEYAYKACGIISYSDGAYGGVRAAEHLRLVCTNLKMPPITAQPAIPFAHKKLSASREKDFLIAIKNFVAQFEWYMQALHTQRKKGLPERFRR